MINTGLPFPVAWLRPEQCISFFEYRHFAGLHLPRSQSSLISAWSYENVTKEGEEQRWSYDYFSIVIRSFPIHAKFAYPAQCRCYENKAENFSNSYCILNYANFFLTQVHFYILVEFLFYAKVINPSSSFLLRIFKLYSIKISVIPIIS